MTAGESAREVARRRREKARRLEMMADAYDRGAAGEEATAAALAALPAGWTVLHDVRWPGRPKANIDHVAIGPGGVFVIDSKHWAGTVSVADDVLRQNGRSREKAVVAVADAALAVTSVIGQLPAVPVLCFVRDKPITGWARDVMICSTTNLVEMLVTRSPTLHQATISRLLPVLKRNLAAASGSTIRRRVPSRLDSTRTRSAPSRSGRRNREPTALRLLGLVGAALALMFVGIPLLSSLGDDVAKGIVGTNQTAEFGSVQSVAANSGHPELRVTVGRPADTTAVGGRVPTAGRRLVAVPISLVNKGDRSWAWDDETRLVMTDAIGTSYAPSAAYRQVAAGRALHGSPTVMPGRTLDRIAVFEVPVGLNVARVLFVVGPGLPTTLRWTPTGAT